MEIKKVFQIRKFVKIFNDLKTHIEIFMSNLHTALIPAHLHIYFYIEKKNKITTTKQEEKKKKKKEKEF